MGALFMPPFVSVGVDLSFRAVSSQVLSALVSLTTVFGMGTGGPSPLKTPTRKWFAPYTIIFTFPCQGDVCNIPSIEMVHLQGLEPWTP